MTIAFKNTTQDRRVTTQDQFRLTYDVPSVPFLSPDTDRIETNVYRALPQVGLVPRSLPSASSEDATIVVRAQVLDSLVNKTVAQVADAANFTGGDFRLGPDTLLGWDVELSAIEYVGVTGSGSVPSGTSPTSDDSAAKTAAEKAAAEKPDTLDKIVKVLTWTAVIAAVVVGGYIFFKATD